MAVGVSNTVRIKITGSFRVSNLLEALRILPEDQVMDFTVFKGDAREPDEVVLFTRTD